MSNFVKLPSGRGVNVGNINRFSSYVPNDPDDPYLYVYFSDSDEHGTTYIDADARALYAYLLAQAVTIGEDGKEVKPEAELEPAKINEIQRSVLEWLSDYNYLSFNLSQIRGHFNVSEAEMRELHELKLVYGSRKTSPEVWFITDAGRDIVSKAAE